MSKNKIDLFKRIHILAPRRKPLFNSYTRNVFLLFPLPFPYSSDPQRKKNQFGWPHLGHCFTEYTMGQEPTGLLRFELINKAKVPSVPCHLVLFSFSHEDWDPLEFSLMWTLQLSEKLLKGDWAMSLRHVLQPADQTTGEPLIQGPMLFHLSSFLMCIASL